MEKSIFTVPSCNVHNRSTRVRSLLSPGLKDSTVNCFGLQKITWKIIKPFQLLPHYSGSHHLQSFFQLYVLGNQQMFIQQMFIENFLSTIFYSKSTLKNNTKLQNNKCLAIPLIVFTSCKGFGVYIKISMKTACSASSGITPANWTGFLAVKVHHILKQPPIPTSEEVTRGSSQYPWIGIGLNKILCPSS